MILKGRKDMNKETVIKLLNECLSSNDNIKIKEKYQTSINLLNDVRKDINLIGNLKNDELNEICHINEDEQREIEFYKLICDLNDPGYKLTYDQISRINELLDKYIKIINQELKIMTQKSEKDNYLKMIIDKIKDDKFVLNYEELNYINRLLKEKNVDISKINQIIVMLSLTVIQSLEEKIKNISHKNISTNKSENKNENKLYKTEVKIKEKNEEKDVANDKKLSDEQFNSDLKNILAKFGYIKVYDYLEKRINEVRKNTTLSEINDLLETIKKFNVDVSSRILNELIINSSKKIIDNVINIYKKLSGMDDRQCFNCLHRHVSIFMKDGDNSSYQDFIKNMYVLEELKITEDDFLLIDIEVLCVSHNRFKKNILTLENYGIPKKDYLKSITVLKSGKNLSDELDMWIELGNSESWSYLRNRLAVLVNNTISNFKTKFRILRDLNINITINDNYKSIRKDLFKSLDMISENGIVCLDGIGYEVKYIPYELKNSKYDELMNKRLIEFQEDVASKNNIYQKFINNTECVRNLYYVIPKVGKISKNKVYRVFNNLLINGESNYREMLIYAITYKSAITEEEYNNVCNYVDKLLNNTLEYKGSVR